MMRVMALSLSEWRAGRGTRVAVKWDLQSQLIRRWNSWIISIVLLRRTLR
jgi:hypothetical protein